jgi:preprotein translocase subunit YajC
MLTVLAIALQQPAARPALLPNIIMIGTFIAIFYFLLIRPQRKMAQKHKELLDSLKKGDEVVTAGGIIGTVLHTEADRITIKTAESTKIVVEKGRIAKVVSAKAEVA